MKETTTLLNSRDLPTVDLGHVTGGIWPFGPSNEELTQLAREQCDEGNNRACQNWTVLTHAKDFMGFTVRNAKKEVRERAK